MRLNLIVSRFLIVLAVGLSPPLSADTASVDLVVEWPPGSYRFSQSVSNTLDFAGQRQTLTMGGEVKVVIGYESSGLTRYAMSYTPEFGSLDGVPLLEGPPAIPEVAVILDAEKHLVDIQDEIGFSVSTRNAIVGRVGQLVAPHMRLSRLDVQPGENWSSGFGDESLRWSLDQHHTISGLAELSFRGIGNLVQVPESGLLQRTGTSLSVARSELAGRLVLDTSTRRLMRLMFETTVVLDIALPGGLGSIDVEMVCTQTMSLVDFQEALR